jgi:hypothetical protein
MIQEEYAQEGRFLPEDVELVIANAPLVRKILKENCLFKH